jgi:hypothetical protein
MILKVSLLPPYRSKVAPGKCEKLVTSSKLAFDYKVASVVMTMHLLVIFLYSWIASTTETELKVIIIIVSR